MAAAPSILGWMASLGDVTRVRALRLLERHELSVAELCDVLQLPQSTVSRHLKVLSDDGWVESRRDGTSRLYAMAEGRPPPARRRWTLLREQVGEDGQAASDDQRLERVLAARRTRSQAVFATSAGHWDKLRGELFGPGLEVPLLAGLLDEAWTVADLGCGTGGLLEALSPFVASVVGVDSSAAMLSAARKRTARLPNVRLERGAMEALPLDDASLDAALVVLVLHHLPEPARALAEAARVLRPGGRLVVMDMQPHVQGAAGPRLAGLRGRPARALARRGGLRRRARAPAASLAQRQGPAAVRRHGGAPGQEPSESSAADLKPLERRFPNTQHAARKDASRCPPRKPPQSCP